MRKRSAFYLSVAAIAIAALLAGAAAPLSAQQNTPQNAAVSIGDTDLGGVVSGANGPEAGVWVIAETTELPTKMAKIVVTDDQGRYVIPDLPKANYSVWVRGYGLVDSPKVQTAPGKILIAGTGAESTAETIAHTSRAAALGFDAALVRTPSFYKPAINDDLLAEHYTRVADAARIPILIYSVPVFTHITVEASLIARVGAHPNIVGIKDSSGSVEGIAKIIAALHRQPAQS